MKLKIFYISWMLFFTIPLFGQNSELFYQDKTSISLGSFFTTNNSISGIIQAEQILIKNRNTFFHVFGGWNFTRYIDLSIGNASNKSNFEAQAYFGGLTLSERLKKNKYIFASIGANYFYDRDHEYITLRKQNFYPLIHLGYKKINRKYLFKIFLTANSDMNYDLYRPDPAAFVGEQRVPKKWYFGLGFSFGRHFF